MRITFLLGVFLIFSGLAVAQQSTIKGRVTSFARPVVGATVTVFVPSGAEQVATTDANGEYRVSMPSPGEYRLVIRNDGIVVYEGRAIARRDDSAASTATDIEIPGISEIVSVAADDFQPIEQVAKTVNIIDGQEMRDRADFSLIEGLRTIPGFRVQQSGGFGRLATVKARGLRNSDTAVLIDGIRFRDPTGITGDASPFLSDFTLTSVERIEVLRGSGSSLYGTNAIGGVIDFQTPSARSGTHGQIGGALGGLGFGRFRGLISHGATNGKFGIGAGISRTIYTRGVDGEDDAHNTNFQTRGDWSPFSSTHFSGRIFFGNADVRLNVNPNTLGPLPASNATIIDARPGVNFTPDQNDPDHFQSNRFFSGQVTADHALNDQLSLSAFYQGLKTHREDENGRLGIGFQPFPGPDRDRFDGEIHTLNTRLSWTLASISRFTAGYEFESETFGNDHLTPTPSGNFSVRAKQRSNTLFLQEMLSLADQRLVLAGGFRAQFFSLGRPSFTPATNATYQNLTLNNPPDAYTGDGSASYFFRSTGTKLRAHVGNGYRVPSLYERFGTFYSDFFGYSNTGDPNLAPERSVAFDAGVDQSFLKNRVRLSGTYFYTDIRRAIDFAFCVPRCLPAPDPLNRFAGYYNTNGRIARGVETSGEFKPARQTRIFTSYTFTNSDERNPLNPFVRTSSGIPSHLFTLVATQRLGRAWVNFDFAATSSYLFPFYNFNPTTFEEKYYVYRFGGSRKGDLTGGYTFGFRGERLSLRIYGTVENVFNQRYFENGFRTARATARIGTTFAF
jgi:vitamin B12 transporter